MILLFDFATQFPFYTKFDCHHSLSVIIWSVHLKGISLHSISTQHIINSQLWTHSQKKTPSEDVRQTQKKLKKKLKNSLTRSSINQRNEQKTDFSSKYPRTKQQQKDIASAKLPRVSTVKVPSCQEFPGFDSQASTTQPPSSNDFKRYVVVLQEASER